MLLKFLEKKSEDEPAYLAKVGNTYMVLKMAVETELPGKSKRYPQYLYAPYFESTDYNEAVKTLRKVNGIED